MCLCPSPLVSCMCRIQFGNCPLHLAANNGYAGAIRMLLEGKADIEARNKVWPRVFGGGMRAVPGHWGRGGCQRPPAIPNPLSHLPKR